ncbi:MAG TPA: polyphosphate kinase 1, partial [Rhodothermales bacterium]|nr:polyphosphate kinase 1 [Rhodothermales bacterium]
MGSAPDLTDDARTEALSGDGAPVVAVIGPPALPLQHATRPSLVPKRATVAHPSLYFNRELSWLDFNARVLVQALDDRVPLLERVRFLCIAASNLDEFFRKRVGGLKRQLEARVTTLTPDGRTPAQQLMLAREAAVPMYATLVETWEHTLRPLLREEVGLYLYDYADLDEGEQERLNAHFRAHIFPILTPLAVDPGHPFPFISDLSLSFAITLRHPTRGTEHFARLKVPTQRGRWLPLSEPHHFVPVEEVIRHNLHELFRGMEILTAHLFRVTRNVEPERDDEETTDLVEMIEEELRERRFAPVVRLEVEADMPSHVRELLTRELELTDADLYECAGMMDLTNCNALTQISAPDHVFSSWEPVIPPRLARRNLPDGIFGVIREGDLMVHHPYESFRHSVQRFVEEAAADPQVVAIKQTLYRTSDEGGVVEALIRAAEAGKQVAVLIEVKARFDEENNLEWGEKLEQAGVHVTYGLVGLKTHAKVTLVVREEDGPDGPSLRTYCHFGTGNYHPKTARTYTDIGLFTCAEDLGYDLVNLFHYLTGYAPEQHYRTLIVAPRDMREAFVRLIRNEIQHQKRHGYGRLIAKMNALDDVDMIQELYRASMAGVNVDLIVRGHCRLRPGLEKFSEHIHV